MSMKMMGKSNFRRIFCLLCFFLIFMAMGAKEYDRIALKEFPVPISFVKKVSGFAGERMNLNREVYIKNFPIEKYVEYIERRDHENWDWTKAEQHGKWLESAFLSVIQSGDKELLSKAENMLDRIISSQEEEGYLGATSKRYRSEQRPVRGMDAYELYFVFHALISIYEQTGNTLALNSAERLANYYIKYFGPGKLEFWPSDLREPENWHKRLSGTSNFAGHSVHYGWEGTLLCDPVARLYEITGKKKYLDWSKWVVSNIDKWSGWNSFSRLDSVASGDLTVYDLQPYVHSHTFHMNFMGFLRLYRITGDKSYFNKVKGAWDDIVKRQMYITGGVSVAEHYEHDYVKPVSGNIVETCATMSWMQLTQSLLELTGDPCYADAMERLMLNHVFAGQDAKYGYCRYHTAPNGVKPEGFFHGPDCCTASGHRVISLLPTFLYATTQDKGFCINQYLPTHYEGNGFGFTVEGDFPNSDTLTINVTEDKKSPDYLKMRMPKWCENPQIRFNGNLLGNVVPGEYYILDRKVKKGDRIELSFPKKIEWVKRKNHTKTIPYILDGSPEILYKDEPDENAPFALINGPIVYSLDMVWNPHLYNDDVDIAKDIKIDLACIPEKMENSEKHFACPLKVRGTYKNRDVELTMIPFSSTGIWYREDMPEPDIASDSFSYGIWLYPIQNAD